MKMSYSAHGEWGATLKTYGTLVPHKTLELGEHLARAYLQRFQEQAKVA